MDPNTHREARCVAPASATNKVNRLLMDDLDREILDGCAARMGAGAAAKLGRHLSKPLRTHALVLRAGDTRWIPGIPVDDVAMSAAMKGSEVDAAERIELEGHEVRRMVEPIFIGPPGVSMREAAALFGVSVNTIRRWEKRGLVKVRRFDGKHQARPMWPYSPPSQGEILVRRSRSRSRSRNRTSFSSSNGLNDYDYENENERTESPSRPPPSRGRSQTEDARMYPTARRFPRLNVTLVTTRHALDPGGEVWQMPWGFVRRYLYQRVDESFDQDLVRVRRRIGAQRGMWQWICPGCGAMVFKVYLALGPWTGRHWFGAAEAAVGERFVCRGCAELVYESAECTQAWDRFVQRLSGGLMRGREVALLPSR